LVAVWEGGTGMKNSDIYYLLVNVWLAALFVEWQVNHSINAIFPVVLHGWWMVKARREETKP